MDPSSRIAENLARVRERIAAAARRAGREPAAITLVGVTKYVDADAARTLAEAGCADLGESRPQELWKKAEALADLEVRWHQVGHLQRNKARRTLPLVSLLHSLDSARLLEMVQSEAARLEVTLPALLEVNISREEAKHGFAPEELPGLAAQLADYPHVEVRGLMAMASLEGGVEVARREFAELRELRDRLQAECPQGVSLDELSMGMSGDFEAAIEEGATMVRLGSVLFEGVEP